MKRITCILSLVSSSLFAQVNHLPVNVNSANTQNINLYSDPEQQTGNKIIMQQTAVQNQVNTSSKKKKETECKECEELKKLKKQQTQQYFSTYVPKGKPKRHYIRHFCLKMDKKFHRLFAKDKKVKPNYSCFNW